MLGIVQFVVEISSGLAAVSDMYGGCHFLLFLGVMLPHVLSILSLCDEKLERLICAFVPMA
jgi:hypothetical protein